MRIEGDASAPTLAAVSGRQAGEGAFPVSGGDHKVQGKETKKAGKSGVSGDSVDISPEAQREIAKLKARDQEVHAHEAAHMAAGGGLVRGGASFSYQRGPDGKTYAVGGEVSINTSPVPNNPAATMAKAEQIRAAALAPADPSPQDLKVAAQASNMAAKAAQELAQKRMASLGSGISSASQRPSVSLVGGGLDITA
jgi:hypothetical protein